MTKMKMNIMMRMMVRRRIKDTGREEEEMER